MEAGTTEHQSPAGTPPNVTLVDPRAPRFGQLLTATLLTAGVVLQDPRLILAVAVILGTAVLSGWRVDLYPFLWRRAIQPLLGPPAKGEPAAPHRFAKLLGASITATATVLLYIEPIVGLAGLAVVGYALAAVVALLAAISGIADYCLGCKLYEQVSYFRRLGIL